MDLMYHYVYRIDRSSTGQFYIGIRSCSCWPTEDTRYMGSGTRIRRIPSEELVKTILVIVQTREEAARIEKHLVRLDDPLSLNLCEGGQRGPWGYIYTQEQRREKGKTMRRSQAAREHLKRLAEFNRGRKDSTETRRRKSKAHQGKRMSQQARENMSRGQTGRRHPEEVKRKISESLKSRAK